MSEAIPDIDKETKLFQENLRKSMTSDEVDKAIELAKNWVEKKH